jgi:pimeloyl-ACP methyl ester carboxylesterase
MPALGENISSGVGCAQPDGGRSSELKKRAHNALAHRDDISDKISSIHVPTLIVHGDSDAAIPLAKARAMKEAIPNVELVVTAGSHSVNMTNPGSVNAALNEFF